MSLKSDIAYDSDLFSILESHEGGASLIPLWFENNYMKRNEDNSNLLVFGSKDDEAAETNNDVLCKWII